MASLRLVWYVAAPQTFAWEVLTSLQLVACVMSIVSQQMVGNGLGRHIETVSAGQLDSFYKVIIQL